MEEYDHIHLCFYNGDMIKLWSFELPESRLLTMGLILGSILCLNNMGDRKEYFTLQYSNIDRVDELRINQVYHLK